MASEFLSEGTEEKSGTWEVMIAAWCLNLAMTRIFVGLFNANMTHSCLHQWICGRDLGLGWIYLRQAWSGLQTELYFVRIIEVSNKYPIDLVWSRKYLLHNYFIKNSGTLAYIVLGFATSFPKSLSCSGKLSNIQSIYRYQNLSYLSFWPFNFRFHIILVLDFDVNIS